MIEFKIITTPDRSQLASYSHAGRELKLGRSEGDMLIDDPTLAPLQVRIAHAGQGYIVESLGPGDVKLNGRSIQGPTPIKERDNLVIGRTTINFIRLDLSAPPIPPPHEHPSARHRFAEGTREKAVLDALSALGREAAGPGGAPPPPKPPLPPTPRKS